MTTYQLRVLYVGSYKPNYPRNKIFRDGLRAHDVLVTECNEQGGGYMKYVRLALRLIRLRGSYDVMLVGFPGQEVMFVAWLCASAPIVFDVFTSHYMGYVLDRAYYAPGSVRSRIYRLLDRWSCRLADVVLLDTQAHIDFFVREFHLPRELFRRVFLGANTDMHHPRPAKEVGSSMTVLFWGSFIPLQGTEHIIQAASILREEPIRFVLIGSGQTRERDMEEVRRLGLKNIEFPGKVSDAELVHAIEDADVCLGAFSDGSKADSTIQNKIFETLASGKPIITARTRAIAELLTDGVNCLLCNAADSGDLANAILRMKHEPGIRTTIAENGHALFRSRLTKERIGRDLYGIITATCKKS